MKFKYNQASTLFKKIKILIYSMQIKEQLEETNLN